MNKVEFVRAVRNKLLEVPLEGRKIWNTTDLYIWWLEVRADNTGLRCEGARMDYWRYVPTICKDLIGNNAVW